MALEAAAPAVTSYAARGWRFIDLAALGDNRVRKYLLTLVAVVVLPTLFVLAGAFVVFLAALAFGIELSESFVVAAVFTVALAALALAGAILALCVRYLHRRPWRSLISADLKIDWRRLMIGAGVEGGLLAVLLYLGYRFAGTPERLGSGLGLLLLPPLLLLIPLQSAAEEMLFRGYLTQALGRLVRSRIAIAAIVGLFFGAVHFNAYGLLTLPYLLLVSMLFSLVSLRDERLELTIGAHTAMNWVSIGLGGALKPGTDLHLGAAAFAVLLVHGTLFYVLTRILVRRFCRPQPMV